MRAQGAGSRERWEWSVLRKSKSPFRQRTVDLALCHIKLVASRLSIGLVTGLVT